MEGYYAWQRVELKMLKYFEIIALAYCGNGPEKLEKAEKLYLEYGKKLLAVEDIKKALSATRKAVAVLDSHMTEMQMGKNCSICASTVRGGCCSAYMGHENNDVLQLLMNLLADVVVKCVRDDTIECCFLSEKGCLLLYKPIFCLNYLCERIQTESTVEDLTVLEKLTGELLRRQVAFEGVLISVLQK
jgi:hypothetical protein